MPALRILAAQAHRNAVCHQRGKSQGFGIRPIERSFAGGHRRALREQPLDFRMRMKAFRQVRERGQQLDQPFARRAGVDLVDVRLAPSVKAGPHARGNFGRRSVAAAARGREAFLQSIAAFVRDAVRFVDRNLAQEQQAIEIALANGRLLVDLLVQEGLRERRLVPLVMSATAVAVHVEHDITLEALAEIHGQVHHLGDALRILAVDVKNRDLQHLGHVGRIRTRTGLIGRRREAELIVHHHMQCAAGRIGRN